MIDEKDIRFEKALMTVLSKFKQTCPLTPCEVFDNVHDQVEVHEMGLSMIPVAVYMSMKIFGEGLIKRIGVGYKLTYKGWRNIRRIEKLVQKYDLKIVRYGFS